jgi:hypothetical protein
MSQVSGAGLSEFFALPVPYSPFPIPCSLRPGRVFHHPGRRCMFPIPRPLFPIPHSLFPALSPAASNNAREPDPRFADYKAR